MSALLKDRVWTMLSEVAKRGVYPLHGNKLGLYRIPIEITEKSDISSIMNDLRSSGFKMDTHADRIYVTYKWSEKGEDPVTGEELSADLNITVEIVTGEVVDLIYQIRQLEYFGDNYWIRNYRQKADQNAKMVIDTIIRNTKIGDKLLAHWQKAEKLTMEAALKKLNELAPLAKNPKARSATAPPPAGPSAVPKPAQAPAMPAPAAPAAGGSGSTTISLTGTGTSYDKVEGPIDAKFKEKRQQVGTFQGIKVWGPYDAPGQLGIWGDYVCIDFDICVADGACIEACPVNVYEWLETPGHPASDKKAFMVREKDCIFCIACENVCPPQAVKIFTKG
ncbi:MAG TPA: 4Fe-4S dicluster domain-containing protein [Nitrososphaera sp.]|jgi:NAD-dependent dihydropyrimidine dehydrogenase PreA subunit|nr:4Fe-4S dicluster domain-containing protein [Nitrososphaera sp.]